MKILSKLLSKETLAAIDAALGAEVLAQVDELTKAITIDAAKEMLIPKATFDAERQKAADYQAQIAERDKQLETLKKTAGDNAALAAQIKELQTANETASKEYADKLAATERDFALKDALKNEFKARDVLSVLPHLKQDAIIYKDGAFTGLKEQVEALSKDKAFLFVTGEPVPSGTGMPFTPPQPGPTDAWAMDFAAVRNVPENK